MSKAVGPLALPVSVQCLGTWFGHCCHLDLAKPFGLYQITPETFPTGFSIWGHHMLMSLSNRPACDSSPTHTSLGTQHTYVAVISSIGASHRHRTSPPLPPPVPPSCVWQPIPAGQSGGFASVRFHSAGHAVHGHGPGDIHACTFEACTPCSDQ